MLYGVFRQTSFWGKKKAISPVVSLKAVKLFKTTSVPKPFASVDCSPKPSASDMYTERPALEKYLLRVEPSYFPSRQSFVSTPSGSVRKIHYTSGIGVFSKESERFILIPESTNSIIPLIAIEGHLSLLSVEKYAAVFWDPMLL